MVTLVYKSMKRKTKIILIIGLIITILGLSIFLLNRMATNQVRQGSKILTLEPFDYQGEFETLAKVVPEKITRYPYNGSLEVKYVEEGTVVSAGTKLVQVNQGNESKVISAAEEGLVYELTDSYLSLASINKILEFKLSAFQKDSVKVGMKIKTEENEGEITFISEVAKEDNEQLYYEAKAKLNITEDFGTKFPIQIISGSTVKAVKVPLDSLVRIEDKTYVFFPEWLDHLTQLNKNDYAEVEVLGNENEKLIITAPQNEAILEFAGLAETYVSELMSSQ